MKKILALLLFLPLTVLTSISFPMKTDGGGVQTVAAAASRPPSGLRVNLLKQALGVPGAGLRFSWVCHEIKSQKYYQIVISASPAGPGRSETIWDTGKVRSSQSGGVTISGLSLPADGLYYWRVRVWNENDGVSAFSDPQAIVTATAWPAGTAPVWVQPASSVQKGNFAFFRAEFLVRDRGKIRKAVVSATASSPESARQYVYTLELNGRFVGVGPARASAGKLEYGTYDVTDALRQGNNAVSALCYAEKGKQFLMQLTVFYLDGTQAVLLSTARDRQAFEALDGTAVFGEGALVESSYYRQAAENIDARLFPRGWSEAGFRAAGWRPAMAKPAIDAAGLTPSAVGNMESVPVEAQSVTDKGNGHYLIDFGRELTGCLELAADSPHAAAMTVLSGEQMNADGTVRYQMPLNVYLEKWTLKEGSQTVHNFLMKTFRYVEIVGCPAKLAKENVRVLALRQPFDEEESDFSSSDSDLNRVYRFAKYTIEATSQNLYVDSQLRERGSYEGDALINMLSAYAVQDEWALPRATADYLVSNPTWPVEYRLMAPVLVWNDYLYTGDRGLIEKTYAALKKGMLSTMVMNPALCLFQTPADGSQTAVLVDWPGSERDGYAMDAKYNTVVNAAAYLSCRSLEKISGALGRIPDMLSYKSMANRLQSGMMQYLYDSGRGLFRDGLTRDGTAIEHWSQHASAFALACGVVSDPQTAGTVADSMSGVCKGSPYGAFFLLRAFYRAGAGEKAIRVMTSSGTRGWLHMLDGLGATLTAEAWDPALKPNMTYSHPWGTAPLSAVEQGMFGITPLEPGFSLFQVKFQPGGVQSARIRVPSVKGPISASYRYDKSGRFTAAVDVPANSSAVVQVPHSAGTLLADGKTAAVKRGGGYDEVRLGFGRHTLRFS